MKTLSNYIIDQLKECGVGHVFGVTGDYVLDFCEELNNSKKIKFINVTDESHAGFAADAYARINGIGCVCATYNVGSFKLVNSTACAYAERSPVVVISGAPATSERKNKNLHHMVNDFDCAVKIFENITCHSVALNEFNINEVKLAFEKLKKFKRPIYIELPRDMLNARVDSQVSVSHIDLKNNFNNAQLTELESKLFEVIENLENSKNPVILAGHQISRCNLGKKLESFAEKNAISICTTLLGKSSIKETHSFFSGTYMGSSGNLDVKKVVESSDCLLILGAILTDVNLGFDKCNLKPKLNVSMENDYFEEFCFNLFDVKLKRFCKNKTTNKNKTANKNKTIGEKLTSRKIFKKINSSMKKNFVVIPDIGDSLFGSVDLKIHKRNHFISCSFYTSMGFAIPASLGVALANRKLRPVVIVGDGAFQMSCSELSTIFNYDLNPIVIVINNKGYMTENKIKKKILKDIFNWNYHNFNGIIGGKGVKANTEEDFNYNFDLALKSNELFLINAIVDNECSEYLENISKRIT